MGKCKEEEGTGKGRRWELQKVQGEGGTWAGQMGEAGVQGDPAPTRSEGTWCGQGRRSVVFSPSLWGGGGTPGALETKVGDGVGATEPGTPPPLPSRPLPSPSLVSKRLYLNLFCAPRDPNSEAPPQEAVSMAATTAGFRGVNQRCHGNPIFICPRC